MAVQIESLINRINQLREDRNEIVMTISNIDGLIFQLRALLELVEMDSVKAYIASQVQFLLIQRIRKREDFDGAMLHTVISGPPGVGKTTVGIMLARIWQSMGIIKPIERGRDTPEIARWKAECERRVQVLQAKSSRLVAHSRSIREYAMRMDVSLSNFERNQRKNFVNEDINVIRTSAMEIGRLSLGMLEGSTPTAILPEVPSLEDPTKIVSRVDFVAEFAGQSSVKTRNLLHENIGKVLLIDEAYSLYHDERDSFGAEALTELNRFMSERPRDIIVIFAGYREAMERSIFHAQPGLNRRCTWKIDMSGYSPAGLGKIFRRQLALLGWTLKEHEGGEKIEDFFTKNLNSFTHYGGDTEVLAHHAKIAYSSRLFLTGQMERANESEITIDDINEGYQIMVRNYSRRASGGNSEDIPPSWLYI